MRIEGRTVKLRRAVATTTAALLLGGVVSAPVASAQENPFERGPDPSEQSIEAARGVFEVATKSVTGGAGFNRGTIYYPTDTSEGKFGAVVISPGFIESQAQISWYGPRLASFGFVVLTIDTNTPFDLPNPRAKQMLAALDYLISESPVRARVDESRLAVMGHSMGGGGSLRAAALRPELEAAIPLTPWHLTSNWADVAVPTLIVGSENDLIAPVAQHAEPFYKNLPRGLDKAYLELDNGSHFAPISPNTTIAKYTLSWLKRFVDNDMRYARFLCPAPTDGSIQEYRQTCPYGP